uniref:Putative secreted protein n=1 Tax=Ixodes ricinus TaxID=34613 RepID=A0A6B0UXF3_IXORI
MSLLPRILGCLFMIEAIGGGAAEVVDEKKDSKDAWKSEAMFTNVGMKDIRWGSARIARVKSSTGTLCTVERTTRNGVLTAATHTPPTTNSLKVNAQLRFQNTTVTMLGKLEEVKGSYCEDNPTTFLNIEDHPPVLIGQKFSHHQWYNTARENSCNTAERKR